MQVTREGRRVWFRDDSRYRWWIEDMHVQAEERWISEYYWHSKETFLYKQGMKKPSQQDSACLSDGLIPAWKNPDLLAFKRAKIKNREGKQRN